MHHSGLERGLFCFAVSFGSTSTAFGTPSMDVHQDRVVKRGGLIRGSLESDAKIVFDADLQPGFEQLQVLDLVIFLLDNIQAMWSCQ